MQGFEQLAQRLCLSNDLAASAGKRAALLASGEAYVESALTHRGVFQIMFRPDVCDPLSFPAFPCASAGGSAGLRRVGTVGAHRPRGLLQQRACKHLLGPCPRHGLPVDRWAAGASASNARSTAAAFAQRWGSLRRRHAGHRLNRPPSTDPRAPLVLGRAGRGHEHQRCWRRHRIEPPCRACAEPLSPPTQQGVRRNDAIQHYMANSRHGVANCPRLVRDCDERDQRAGHARDARKPRSSIGRRTLMSHRPRALVLAKVTVATQRARLCRSVVQVPQ